MANNDVTIRIRATAETSEIDRARQRLAQLSGTAGDMSRSLAQGEASYSRFKSALADTVVYGGAFVLLNTLTQIPAKIYEVGNAYQGLNSTYLAVFGTQGAGNQQMQFAADLANRLGQDVLKLSDDYGKWSAAVQGTTLAGKQSEAIFTSVSQAAKVLNLSADDTSSALRAMQQMVSKGKVSAEELRGQLGERLPGAFRLAADAMGVTTAQLDKMLQNGQVVAEDLLPKLALELNKKYGGEALTKATQSLSSEVNRLQNSLVGLANKGFVAVEPAASAAVRTLNGFAKDADAVYAVVSLLGLYLAGRGVAALVTYGAAKVRAAVETRALMLAEREATLAAATTAVQTLATARAKAQAMVVEATANETRLQGLRAAIQLDVAAARGTEAYAASLARLNGIQANVAKAQLAANAARAEYAAVTAAATQANAALSVVRWEQAAVSTGVFATALRGVGSSLLAFTGGPVGAAILAIGGLIWGLNKLKESEEASRGAIKDSHGEWVKYADITHRATELSREYAGASPSRQQAIENETKLLQDNTAAELKNAEAKLATLEADLAKTRAFFDKQGYQSPYDSNGEYIGSDYQLTNDQANQAVLNSYNVAIQQQKTAIAQLRNEKAKTAEVVSHLGTVTDEETQSVAGNTAAVEQNIKVLHSHGDALKSVVESITKQRIELENGKVAAQYYADRLAGLTDKEARLAAAGRQTNSFLELRNKIQQDLASQSESYVDKFQSMLKDAGLSDSALAGIDAAKHKTDTAVGAAEQFRIEIERVSESAKKMGNDVAAAVGNIAGVGQVTNVSLGAAKGTAQQVVAILERLGESRKNAISIASNLKQESEFNPKAVGDGGKAFGLAQWHADRQQQFAKAFGKDIQNSTLEEQLRFVVYELRKGNEIAAGRKLDAANNVREGAAVISQYYERPQAVEVEKTRRADIATAIDRSIGNVTNEVTNVVAETKKIQPAAEKAIPSWEKMGQQATVTKTETVEYRGQLDATSVTQSQINDLQSQYLDSIANPMLDAATKHKNEVKLTAYAFREAELAAMKLGDARAANILNEESTVAYLQEIKALNQEIVAAKNPGGLVEYKRGLDDKVLSDSQKNELVQAKIRANITNVNVTLDQQIQKLRSTNEQWRAHELALDGIPPKEQAIITAKERTISTLELYQQAIQSVSQSFENDLLSSLTTGKLSFQSFADSVLQEAVRLYAVKPIMDYLFGGMGSGSNGGMGGGVVGNIMQSFGLFHAGGVVGVESAGSKSASPAIFSGAPRFHAGGVVGLARDEVPVILQRGEGVFTREQMAALAPATSGGNVQVAVQPQINIQIVEGAGTKAQVQQQRQQDGSITIRVISEAIQGDILQSGGNGSSPLMNFLDNRYLKASG